MATTPILCLDPQAFWRSHISRLLHEWTGAAVRGAAQLADAATFCSSWVPALVITETVLADGDISSICQWVESVRPVPAVLFLTARTDFVTLHELKQVRARGVLWKTPDFECHLHTAVTTIIEGRSYISDDVRNAMQALRKADFLKWISDAEQQFLKLFGQGRSLEEIARQLGCTVSTARSHAHRLRRKLGLGTRGELLQWAWENGYTVDRPEGRLFKSSA